MILLILEDDCTMMKYLLEDFDWVHLGIKQKITARSVPEGCNALEKNAVDLMICDVEVIKGTGIDLLRWAREQGYTAECIFLTNYSEFQYAREAVRLGSIDYILKTEPKEVLYTAVYKAVRRIHAQLPFFEVDKFEVPTIVEEHKEQEEMITLINKWEQFLQNGEKIKLINSVKNYLDKAQKEGTLNSGSLFALYNDLIQMIYKILKIWNINASDMFFCEDERKLYRNAPNSSFDLLKWLNQFAGQAIIMIKKNSQSETITQKVKSYIADHFNENINRQELADMLFVNSDYLSRVFNKEAGIQIPDYIMQIRMEEAKRLLHTDDSISNIAVRIGMDNYSYFSTVFKKYTGLSPMEYRKVYRD